MKIDYQQALRDLAHEMVQVREPNDLLTRVTEFLDEEMGLQKAAVAVLDRKRNCFLFYVSRGEKKIPESLVKLDKDNALIDWFSQYPKNGKLAQHYLDLKQIDQLRSDQTFIGLSEGKIEDLTKIESIMRGFGVCACFPGYFKKELLGLLFVGSKKDQISFTREETIFLQTVASDVSMSLKSTEYQTELENKVGELETSLETIQRLHTQDKEKYLQMIFTLANIIDAKDPYTRGHSEEVERLGVACLKYLKKNFSKERIQLLSTSLKLHDFGKLAIADEILKKPAALTDEEMTVMREHPTLGADILEQHADLKEVAKIVRHHHEMYDGSGYPSGLKKEEIPLEARIICVVDSFHAMFSDRPYRKGLSLDICREELIKNKGKQFDPEIVDAFLHVLENDLYLTD